MRTRSRRLLRLASSTALAVLTLGGLAAAGVRVTLSQVNTPAPSRLTGHLPVNRPTSDGPLVVGQRLPGALGGVAAAGQAVGEVVEEVGHRGWPVHEVCEHIQNERCSQDFRRIWKRAVGRCHGHHSRAVNGLWTALPAHFRTADL